MNAPFVAGKENLTLLLFLLQVQRTLHECSCFIEFIKLVAKK